MSALSLCTCPSPVAIDEHASDALSLVCLGDAQLGGAKLLGRAECAVAGPASDVEECSGGLMFRIAGPPSDVEEQCALCIEGQPEFQVPDREQVDGG